MSNEPYEAGAEHGVGGSDEGGSEGFGRGERVGDLVREVGGLFGGFRGEGGEKLVIGPGHAGMVEEGGGVGLACMREY